MQTACLTADGLSLCPIERKGDRYERRSKEAKGRDLLYNRDNP